MLRLKIVHDGLEVADHGLEKLIRAVVLWLGLDYSADKQNRLHLIRVVPHLLSLSRVGLAVVIWRLLLVPASLWVIVALFILAMITDRLDGTWARLYGGETTFGQMLDPFCDKLFLVILLLAFLPLIWWPVFWLLIGLELALALTPLLSHLNDDYRWFRSGIAIRANRWGKTKFVCECVALSLLIVFGATLGALANLILALACPLALLSVTKKLGWPG